MVKKPRFLLQLLLVVVLSTYTFSLFTHPIYSDEASDLQQQIDQKNAELAAKQSTLSSIEAKIKEISGSNNTVSQKIALINAEITKLNDSIALTDGALNAKIKEIEDKQALLEAKKVEMDKLSTDLYIRSRYRMATFFLSGNDWNTLVKEFFLKQNSISTLKNEVEAINGEFSNLAESRAELENQKATLDAQKKDMDDSYALLAAEKAKLQSELNSQNAQKKALSSDITDLTKKVSQLQAAITAYREGGVISSGGTTGSELGTSISQAPAGHFGVFSIGAYTHRSGMSQWGARARADTGGQSYSQILAAYYPTTTLNTNYSEPVNIVIRGNGLACNGSAKYYNETIPFSTYMNRIFEMPSSWNQEAVKAQAIASRSYAISEFNRKGYVIPSQSDQVYKDCDNTAAWISAVNATRNQVLTSNGSAHKAFFAAVHGGWVNGVGWDTQTGDGSNWFNNSWDKLSGVTWFYKSWYRYGTSSSGTNCGHSPWLSQAEMVDMVNSYLVKTGSGLKKTPDLSRILPSDFGTCANRPDYGRTDKVPYSSAELKGLLNNPVQSISSVVTVQSTSSGNTTGVVFSTNVGSINITGMAFKDIYNQVAPGQMRIQQQSSYAFFNVEKN